MASGCAEDVMAVSTASATLNQALLPKRSFELACKLATRFGGGVIVAHTGTIVGVLLHPERDRVQGVLAHIRAAGLSPVVHTLG